MFVQKALYYANIPKMFESIYTDEKLILLSLMLNNKFLKYLCDVMDISPCHYYLLPFMDSTSSPVLATPCELTSSVLVFVIFPTHGSYNKAKVPAKNYISDVMQECCKQWAN